ncbi:Protein of unknown function [Gryllus bimaculatus]|nr:Protein of unknown function [Gryllus bimaculatus]
MAQLSTDARKTLVTINVPARSRPTRRSAVTSLEPHRFAQAARSSIFTAALPLTPLTAPSRRRWLTASASASWTAPLALRVMRAAPEKCARVVLVLFSEETQMIRLCQCTSEIYNGIGIDFEGKEGLMWGRGEQLRDHFPICVGD